MCSDRTNVPREFIVAQVVKPVLPAKENYQNRPREKSFLNEEESTLPTLLASPSSQIESEGGHARLRSFDSPSSSLKDASSLHLEHKQSDGGVS